VWGYDYTATVKTTVSSRLRHRQAVRRTTVSHQHWADTYSNGDGQVPAAGNITG
jgi:hypothetical protein